MCKSSLFHSKFLALFLAGAFIVLMAPVREFAQALPGPGVGTGALAGHIYNEDMRTPVRNAIVKLRNVTSQKEYESEPTDPDGMYRIPGVEEGRYVMGVVSVQGDYNFQYSILIKSNALAKLSVAMKPGGVPTRIEQGTSPNSAKKKNLGDFFKSPAGILTLITVVEATLFALALSEGEASPIR
jgi:hypothetical protein